MATKSVIKSPSLRPAFVDPDPDKIVAYLFGYPLTSPEALAFMDMDAGTATPEQLAVLTAWVVKMTLVHGSRVVDDMADYAFVRQI